MDGAGDPTGTHWGTSNRQTAEQGRVDTVCHGPVGETNRESRGTLTLEGQQWLRNGNRISTGELDYYLTEYTVPSPSQTDGEAGNDTESDSEDDRSQTEADGLDGDEHGIILELPSNTHQCPKCSVVLNTMRVLRDHLVETHGIRDVLFRCRLCKTIFDRVHRLECHATRCKKGERTPSEADRKFGCDGCTDRFLTKSGKSQHERHRHPETANNRRINATKLEAKQKQDKRHTAKRLEKQVAEREQEERLAANEGARMQTSRERETNIARETPEKANEARVLRTEWDEAATEIFLDIYCEMGDEKGLHARVRAALQVAGYEFSLKRISERKRTKGFRFALLDKQEKNRQEEEVAPDQTGEAAQSAPDADPNGQKTAHNVECMDTAAAETLLLSLEEANEARVLQTKWDAEAIEILLDYYCKTGDTKGLHTRVRAALRVAGYDISQKRISERKRTKGFQTALLNRQKANGIEEEVAPDQTGEAEQSTPKADTSGQKTAYATECLDSYSVETLLLSLETSGDESEASIAAICRTVQKTGTEGEAAEVAYAAHEKLLNDFIAPGPMAPTTGAKMPRYRKETKVRKIRTKTLKGKAKEKVERYRNLQQKWKRNKKNAVKQVLDGASDAKCQIDAEVIEATYTDRFESVGPRVDLSNYPGPFSEPVLPTVTTETDSDHEQQSGQSIQSEPRPERLLEAVRASEVRKAVRAMRTGSAAGPDRITVAQLKKKTEENPGFLAGVYTLWMMKSKVPEKLKASRSLLLPKGTTELQNIGNWRPLSISSVIMRLYTKILAKRLTKAVSLHPSQRGFIPAPGVEQNSVLLEHLIRKQKKEKGTLAVAFLDLAKAFDTISHDLFAKGLQRLGVPSQFIKVVEDLYDGATTSFATVKGETRQIKINQGVKQGDPLSPILFNVCLDPMFCSLERDGKGWGNEKTSITALGYADDTAVLSDSRAGLEKNLALVKAFCDQVGLRLNVNKSYVFHIISDGRTFTVNDTAPYEIDGGRIPWVSPDNATRYLGKMFGPWGGMSVPNLKQQIEEWARSVAAAPLKPMQALEIWRDTILPRIKARILHSRPSAAVLKSLDTQIRGHVKTLLHLPEQISNAMIYAKTRNGGLGITCLEDAIPDLTIRGLHKLCWKAKSGTIRRHAQNLGVRDTYEDLCTRHPQCRPAKPGNKKREEEDDPQRDKAIPRNKWCEYLASQKTQGMGSTTWMKYRECNSWIRTNTFTNGETIDAILLRSNCIPTRECISRYTQSTDTKCRRCGMTTETCGHISGWCPSVKRSRILRHNSLCKILGNKALKQGWTVHWEPILKGPKGKLKPDLIFVKDEVALVVDPTVIWESDAECLVKAAQAKVAKYSQLVNQIKERFGVTEVQVFGLPIGARGGWTPGNDQVLRALGVPMGQTRRALSVRALGGTIALISLFFDQ